MKCYIKHQGVIREKKENEEVFVNKKKIEKPLGIDLDLGAVRYAVGMRAEVVYGKIEFKEKKEQKPTEQPEQLEQSKPDTSTEPKNQKIGSKSVSTKKKTS